MQGGLGSCENCRIGSFSPPPTRSAEPSSGTKGSADPLAIICSLLWCPRVVLFKGKAGVPAVFWTSFDVWLWQGCNALANCAVTWIMFDVMMLVLVFGCFALAAAYASLCDRLLTRTGKDLPS